MVKHIIDIPKETNDKIRMMKIKHPELKNVSDVVEYVVMHDPDDDGCSWKSVYRENGVSVE